MKLRIKDGVISISGTNNDPNKFRSIEVSAEVAERSFFGYLAAFVTVLYTYRLARNYIKKSVDEVKGIKGEIISVDEWEHTREDVLDKLDNQ